MRTKMSFTIDEDLCNWLRNHYTNNMSDFLNAILRREMEVKKDFTDLFKESLLKRNKAEEEYKEVMEKIQRIKIEGNIKEREEAKKILKEEKKKQKEKINELEEKYALIKDKKLWQDFLSKFDGNIDHKESIDLAVKLQEKGIKIGGYDIRNILKNLNKLRKNGN